MESSITSNDGYWHHYAGTFNAATGERNLYVDGVLAAQEELNQAYYVAATEHVVIGGKDSYSAAAAPQYGNYLGGFVFDVRIYNYALTLPQINAAILPDYVNPPTPFTLSEISLTTNSTAGKGYYGGKFKLTFTANWCFGSKQYQRSVDGSRDRVALHGHHD